MLETQGIPGAPGKDEARNKCALCNETLTHIVKQAEAQTGAGTATVTRELADRINEDTAPGDQVSDRALTERVRRMEEPKNTNRVNKIGNSENKKEENKMGRPLKFKSVKELQKKIDAYFDSCWKQKDPLGVAELEMVKPYTITGLAVFLETTRDLLLDYEDRAEFSDTIKQSKMKIQAWTEEQLFRTTQVAGVIFNLKNNWGFKDQQEHSVSTPGGKPLSFEVRIVDPEKK